MLADISNNLPSDKARQSAVRARYKNIIVPA